MVTVTPSIVSSVASIVPTMKLNEPRTVEMPRYLTESVIWLCDGSTAHCMAPAVNRLRYSAKGTGRGSSAAAAP